MIHKTFQFDFKDLKLTVSQIEKVLGYTEKNQKYISASLSEKH